MGELGLAAAFIGGALTLISPCSALLLPSFFAYAFADPRALVARTAVFWLGLCVTVVPLGAGSALVSTLFYGHRGTLITLAGWLIIAMGVLQFLGGGFAFPGADRLRARLTGTGRTGSYGSTFALGAVYGLAGFCSGPILGSVLTIAAAQGDVVAGGALLAVFALGMAAPMFVLALVWDRFHLGGRRWLKGRAVRLGPLRLHTSQLVAGTLFVLVGVLFLRYDGTAGIVGILGVGDTTDAEFAVQVWIGTVVGSGWDIALLAGAASVLLGLVLVRLHRRSTAGEMVPAGREPAPGALRPGPDTMPTDGTPAGGTPTCGTSTDVLTAGTRVAPPDPARLRGSAWTALSGWGRRRWVVAAGATVLAAVVVAVPTDLIDTPLFSREIPPTWWSWPALVLSSVLSGLLAASYVRGGAPGAAAAWPGTTGAVEDSRGKRWGSLGGLLTLVAVGCPVCNKVVLLALGAGGALTWFAPVQPALSAAAVLLLGWALHRRLRGELSCPVPGR